MSRLALAGLALVLTAALAAEIMLDGTGDAPLPAPPGKPPLATAARTETPDIPGWTATILARPLFAPDRRPIATATTAAATQGLPRLSGIVVTTAGRQAIFAADGRQVALAEGGRIGAYTVAQIDAGSVTIEGPEGRRLLRPSFASGPEAEAREREVPKAPPPPQTLPPGNAPSGLDLLQSSRKFPIPAASKQ